MTKYYFGETKFLELVVALVDMYHSREHMDDEERSIAAEMVLDHLRKLASDNLERLEQVNAQD